MMAAFFAAYGAVFLAEIAGDKLLYTTGVLSARYRPLPIMVGVIIAFMLKMAVAVMLGEAISHLPKLLVAGVTAAPRVVDRSAARIGWDDAKKARKLDAYRKVVASTRRFR